MKPQSLAIRFHRLIVASLLVGAAVAANAQSFKIGFVNPDRVLREANSAKAAQAKFEAEFSKREKDLTDQGNVLKAASDKYDREAPTLSESQRATRQRALADQDRDFQRKRREFQEDVNTRRNEELQGLLERANRVIRQVAEAEGYDAILDSGVYINPKNDLTDKIIKALNAQPAGPASPASATPSK